MSFKTMDEITADLERLGVSMAELTKGIMNQNTFAQWKSRGLPSSITKYKQILDKLETLNAKNQLESEWAASTKHGV